AALDVGGAGSVAFQITGSAVGTIQFEASYDNVTYFAVLAQSQVTGVWASTTTATGNFVVPVLGYYRVRANRIGTTSGTFTVHKVAHLSRYSVIATGQYWEDAA